MKGLLRVDKRFRIPGPERIRELYKLRSSVERLNSRLSTMIGRIAFNDLKAAITHVSSTVLALFFIAQMAIKTGKPSKARSITYYVYTLSRPKELKVHPYNYLHHICMRTLPS